MGSRLPLFPLGLVLVPGMVLPLHVFEERYRALVRDLLDRPKGERRFGVVAIRSGREVGPDGVLALHEVGTTALLRQVVRHGDGRFDLLTTGEQRFRLLDVQHDEPYLVGQVEELPERDGQAAGAQLPVAGVRAAFRAYAAALGVADGSGLGGVLAQLPADARALSYHVAAAARLDLEDRQTLLELPDDAARLHAALALLRREVRLIGTLSAVPAPELTRTPLSPN